MVKVKNNTYLMKTTASIVVCLFICTQAFATKRYLVNQGEWGAFYNGSNYTYKPGDTLVFKNSNTVTTMGLENFHGTVKDTLYITNEKGEVSNLPTLLLRGCSFIKLTGSNTLGEYYGLFSNKTFSAIDIDGRSHDILIERIKITNAWYSVRAKQDGSCDDKLNYPNFHMNNITVRYTWSKNISADVFYMGNTAPATGRPVPDCPSKSPLPIPMRLSNIILHDNYIEHAGRTAIQLSGCDSGYNAIYNNTIIGSGYENSQSQGTGIIIGGMTQNCHVYNNKIRQTFQFGIWNIGYRTNYIENNNIDSAGIYTMTERDKSRVTNTDTAYLASRCYFFDMGERTAGSSSVKLVATKVTGTASGYAYVVGKPFADTAWAMTTENTFPQKMHPISDTFYFKNTGTQSHIFKITGNSQFYKIVIKQKGIQVMQYNGYVLNNWYPYSIGLGTRDTYPAGDSASAWIRNNIVANGDSARTGSNIAIPEGAWSVNGDNRVCGNTKQNGQPAHLNIHSSFHYTTNKCTGTSFLPKTKPKPHPLPVFKK
jgi:hypothetical protein